MESRLAPEQVAAEVKANWVLDRLPRVDWDILWADERDEEGRMSERAVPFHCPYCGEPFETSADLSAGSQSYTEDCHVCCQPILVHLTVDEDTGRFEVDVDAENQ